MPIKFSEEQTKEVVHGLEGVKSVATIKSKVDGSGEGALFYEGYSIFDLAEKSCFEEVAYLLLYDKLPTKKELEDFSKTLYSYRSLNSNVVEIIKKLKGHPMAVLRTAVSALSSFDEEAEDFSDSANERRAIKLIAQIPVIIAIYSRLREGKKIIEPDSSLNTAANFVYMLTGQKDELKAKIMDKILILHADHGLNASTFAARVTASTLSDMYSAITSAVGALKGPLHGGANEQVLKMLFSIKGSAREWVLDKLSRKEKIMGIGHRVYKGGDPRAKILKKYAEQLSSQTGNSHLFEKLDMIEKTVYEQKGLKPNVDFYSALVLYCIGIPSDLFTPIFAMSRIAGWTAHVLEQYANNRLIRPKSVYVEELAPLGRNYVEIDKR